MDRQHARFQHDDAAPLMSPCERARFRASLAFDGELPATEVSLLQRHLTRCSPCTTYATDIVAITALLRLNQV